MRSKTIATSLLVLILLPRFLTAQETVPEAPQTVEEAKSFGTKILTALPNAIKNVWNNQAVPLWLKMWDWTKGLWNRTAGPIVTEWWQKFLGLLGKEVEKRGPMIKEEFQKEKQEIKEDVPRVGKSLWERFKELIK